MKRDHDILVSSGASHEIKPHVIVTDPFALPKPIEPPPCERMSLTEYLMFLLAFIIAGLVVLLVAHRG